LPNEPVVRFRVFDVHCVARGSFRLRPPTEVRDVPHAPAAFFLQYPGRGAHVRIDRMTSEHRRRGYALEGRARSLTDRAATEDIEGHGDPETPALVVEVRL